MSGPVIAVLIKQVLDPEAPASSFRIDSTGKNITGQGVPPVINPYDESALELALRIKEANPETRIVAVAFGKGLARPVLMKSLAVGADELYLIEDSLEEADGRATAAVLAAAVKKIAPDLVLAGRQAADTNAGSVGLAVAETLGLAAVSWVRKVEVSEGVVTVEKITPNGYEVVRGPLPALCTVSHEAGGLRMPKLPDIRKAKQKPIHNWGLADLEMDGAPASGLCLQGLEKPARERQCRFIEGDSDEEAGSKLAEVLMEEGILSACND